MPKKRLLILKTSSDICKQERGQIQAIARLIGIAHDELTIKSVEDVYGLASDGKKFDYIYLCGHANENDFGEANGGQGISWTDFAMALCNVDWLNPQGVLFLATCRGGLPQIAHTMFSVCGKIDYICGPLWTVDMHDLTTAFHVFIYNLEIRGEEPSVAIDRAFRSTGRRFFCYDRVECAPTKENDQLSLIRYRVEQAIIDVQQLKDFVADKIADKPAEI